MAQIIQKVAVSGAFDLQWSFSETEPFFFFNSFLGSLIQFELRLHSNGIPCNVLMVIFDMLC